MGGRDRKPMEADRDSWIGDVSDTRLANYAAMLDTAGAERRLDGSPRVDRGATFRALVGREIERRGR